MKTLKQDESTRCKAADDLLVPKAQPEISQTRSVWLAFKKPLSVLKGRWKGPYDGTRTERMPEIRFALSRGFAVSGFVFWATLPRAALADSLALGYFRPPFLGFHLTASPISRNSSRSAAPTKREMKNEDV
jgi:hypothetical protein